MKKLNVAIDFDGTICEDTPFKGVGVIEGKPEPNAVEVITKLSEHFNIIVFSVRAKSEVGKKAIEEWMRQYNVPYSLVTATKEMAIFYIDNRAIRYNGDWKQVMREIATLDIESEKPKQ